MKKNIFIILLIFLFPIFTLFGQEQIDVIYLNNGDIAKGLIIENVLDDYVKIELSGGSIFTFKYSDILLITKEESSIEKLLVSTQQKKGILTELPKEGNIGITTSLQSSQLDFIVPIFVSENLSLSPAFGFSSNSELTNISFGAILRYYLLKDMVSPFIGGRLGAIISSPKNGDALAYLVLGTLSGCEYFFSKHFSVGIELQLNIINSLSSSTSTNINTATAFFATIYF